MHSTCSDTRQQRCPAGRGLWDPPCCGAGEPHRHRHKEAGIYWRSSRWVSYSSSFLWLSFFFKPNRSSSIFPFLRSVPSRQHCHQEAIRGLCEECEHQPEPGRLQQGRSSQWSCQHWNLSSSVTLLINNHPKMALTKLNLESVLNIPTKSINFRFH